MSTDRRTSIEHWLRERASPELVAFGLISLIVAVAIVFVVSQASAVPSS